MAITTLVLPYNCDHNYVLDIIPNLFWTFPEYTNKGGVCLAVKVIIQVDECMELGGRRCPPTSSKPT